MEISIWFAHQVISNIMRFFSYLIPASNFESRITVSFYLQSASNILCIFLFRRYLCHFSDKKEISIKKLRICLWGVLAGIGVCLAHRLIFLFFPQIGLNLMSQVSEEYILDMNRYQYSPMIFMYIILLAPITEEIFNRGIIFPVAQKRHGNVYAVMISAFLFALGHYNLPQFITALCLGLLIGYFVVSTGNVYIGIVLHMANNMYAGFRGILLGDKIWELSNRTLYIESVVGVFILVFSIFAVKHETK